MGFLLTCMKEQGAIGIILTLACVLACVLASIIFYAFKFFVKDLLCLVSYPVCGS